MDGLEFIKKDRLTASEIDAAFNILKINMLELNVPATEEDKALWSKSLKQNLQDNNFAFYLIYLRGELVGFVETLSKGNSLNVCEVQLANRVKHTKVILEVIKHLYSLKEAYTAEEVTFSILKNNEMSNKTFSHLGGKIVWQSERKNYYSLSPELVEKYLKTLHQI